MATAGRGSRVRLISDDPAFRAPATKAAGAACLDCGIADPPPEQTCTEGRDHRVGLAAGCPGCGRLKEACAARPCSAARAGKPPPDILGDLEVLEHHWGEAYAIGAGDGGYTADRRDGRGATLAAADRDGLLAAMQADYAADPVPRDLP